jgi:Domain of unknown function (DUF1707)
MSNQYFWPRIAGPDPNLRAADADRERVADRLRKSHTEGRLDIEEFQERLERCYRSKTLGELRELVSDLPRQDLEGDQRRSPRSLWIWRRGVAPLVPILFALVLISAVAGHHGHHVVWLWIPLLFLFWRLFWWPRRRRWAGPRRGSHEWI